MTAEWTERDGTRLTALRERAGLRQVDASRKLSVAQSTLAGYESGRRYPGAVVGALAALYGCTTDAILVESARIASNAPDGSSRAATGVPAVATEADRTPTRNGGDGMEATTGTARSTAQRLADLESTLVAAMAEVQRLKVELRAQAL